ncbi:MAG TPA: hypothetical protein VNG51_10415 [Ktedonobacteraceae bacterium]|nr:hypothetical protein [Ktedonobacteraceae bacterium]
MSDQENSEHSLQDDRPPRNKVRLAFTITLFLVIVLLLVAIFSPVRDIVVNRFLTTAPTPTATLVAGDDLIDIQATPTGTITIDGHVIKKSTNPYSLNFTDKPIRLPRGQHKIVWQAPPFLPLTCIISVPPLSTEPCNYESTGNSTTAPGERLITFNATMADLPATQQTTLKQTIQAALTSMQSTDIVQPGEQYVSPSGATLIKTATQSLQATLQFQLDANPASQHPCQNGYGDTCSLNGQNCLQLCTLPEIGVPSTKSAPLTWDIYALFYPSWTYTTQSGQIIAQNQPDSSNMPALEDHSIALRITWDGTKWQASPDTSSNTLEQGITPISCASINNQISATTQYGVTASGTNVDWGYAVGTNEAQGCLAVVVPSPGQQTPTNFKQPAAYFLYRFGVLLAANPRAHSEFPNVPMADANEQAIAQSIAAKLKF